MSNSGPYRDGPNQLKYEAQQISLTFVKDTPETGLLTWNIPAPVFGCNEDARAYNGIVITASRIPVTQSQKPINGTFYSSDSTVSTQLHAGDVIGDAIVVGAFYDDDTTTSLRVTDIESQTAYYFSAYAVSLQGIYDPAGAHAYSLPLGREGEFKDFPAYQEIRVLGPANKRINIRSYREQPVGSMLGEASTNLTPTTEYIATICSDLLGDNIELPIVGAYAQTWDQLVTELNKQIALSTNPTMSHVPPNTGSLYLDVANSSLFKWVGESYEKQSLIVSDLDPSAPVEGSWWYDATAAVLYNFVAGSWVAKSVVRYTKPYNHIVSGDYWINLSGNFAAEWEGTTWCKRNLSTATIDPSLAVTLPGGTFWYDTETGFMHEWETNGKCWKQIPVMYSAQDPSNLMPGQMWYDYEANKLFSLNAAYKWVEETARVNEIAAKAPADGAYWINPKTDEVKQYNFATKTWTEVDAIEWASDPTDRASCDKWWNTTEDKLYVWDFLSEDWVEVLNFVQSDVDPALAPVLPKNTVWTSPEGIKLWDGMQWMNHSAVVLDHDPRSPVTGDITFDGTTFWQRSTTSWVALQVLMASNYPTVPLDTYWYTALSMLLRVRTATGWVASAFVTRPQVPETGSQYFDTSTMTMKEWKNGRYVAAELPAHFFISELNNLTAVSKTLGSQSSIKLGFDQVFKDAIKPAFFGFESVIGSDGISPVPSYKTQGVGTDGSVDERREYANYVLSQLGYPKVQVELSKRQVDEAIDDALEVLRMRTSAVYSRRYMAMDLHPNQQTYEFSNRSQGLDKVVRVTKIHRSRSGRLGVSSYDDTFGSAMIQQLYTAGSFDLLSYHLLASYTQLMNTIFANDITFHWNEYDRSLQIQQTVRTKERVLVEVEIEKTEQELLVDRNLRSWLKKYVLGKSMLALARIRGKFGSLPGAGGGIALNGSDLATEGATFIEECLADIDNMVISGLDQYGSSSMVVMG